MKDDDFFDFLKFNEIFNSDNNSDCDIGGCGCFFVIATAFLALLLLIASAFK